MDQLEPLQEDTFDFIVSERRIDQLYHRSFLYNCQHKVKWNDEKQLYELTWYCINYKQKGDKICRGSCFTNKFDSTDRNNSTLSHGALNHTKNRALYPNYNFRSGKGHSCNGLTQQEYIGKRFTNNELSEHLRSLSAEHVDSMKKPLQIVKDKMYTMKQMTNPVVREAMDNLGQPEGLVRRVQRAVNYNAIVEEKVVVTQSALDMDPNTFPRKYRMSDAESEAESNEILLHTENRMIKGKMHTLWIYGSLYLLQELFKQTRVFLDATFKTCPHQFYQTFLIHFILNGFTVTAVRILMTGKHTNMYRWVFEKLFQLDFWRLND